MIQSHVHCSSSRHHNTAPASCPREEKDTAQAGNRMLLPTPYVSSMDAFGDDNDDAAASNSVVSAYAADVEEMFAPKDTSLTPRRLCKSDREGVPQPRAPTGVCNHQPLRMGFAVSPSRNRSAPTHDEDPWNASSKDLVSFVSAGSATEETGGCMPKSTCETATASGAASHTTLLRSLPEFDYTRDVLIKDVKRAMCGQPSMLTCSATGMSTSSRRIGISSSSQTSSRTVLPSAVPQIGAQHSPRPPRQHPKSSSLLVPSARESYVASYPPLRQNRAASCSARPAPVGARTRERRAEWTRGISTHAVRPVVPDAAQFLDFDRPRSIPNSAVITAATARRSLPQHTPNASSEFRSLLDSISGSNAGHVPSRLVRR